MKRDIAQLRGEIFGLEVLVMNSLGFIAAHTTDPKRHLRAIAEAAAEGISAGDANRFPAAYRHIFEESAKTVIARCLGAAEHFATADRLRQPDG